MEAFEIEDFYAYCCPGSASWREFTLGRTKHLLRFIRCAHKQVEGAPQLDHQACYFSEETYIIFLSIKILLL